LKLPVPGVSLGFTSVATKDGRSYTYIQTTLLTPTSHPSLVKLSHGPWSYPLSKTHFTKRCLPPPPLAKENSSVRRAPRPISLHSCTYIETHPHPEIVCSSFPGTAPLPISCFSFLPSALAVFVVLSVLSGCASSRSPSF